jgi:ParB/RepB/Spo0J family partition protein
MARLKDMAVSRGGDSFIFDPEQIDERPGYNVRNMESIETQEHIRRMADAIHAGGTAAFPPITICQEDGRIYVIAGYCRRRAFILAKNEGAPVKGILAIANNQREDERTLDLLNSNDGLPLTAIEKAKVVQKLVSFQWTPAEIARRRGVSVTSVLNALAILEAPSSVQALIESGEVSATLAVATIKTEGVNAAVTLTKAVKVAKESGKKKATAKHISKPSAEKVINWVTHGPKLVIVLEGILNASGSGQQKAIDAAGTLLDKIKGELAWT